MQNLIREKRRLHLSYKRITPQIIRQLAQVLDQEVVDAARLNRTSFYIYTVDATDNSSYESQSVAIFNENEIIERKVVSKVTMRFNLIDNSKSIDVQFMHIQEDDEKRENYVAVSGDDPIWVNGVISRFSEIISSAENQPKYNKYIGLGAVAFCIALMVLYSRVFDKRLETWNKDFAGWIWLVVFVAIIAASVKLYNFLQSQYSTVELQTGANYMQIPRKKRHALAQVLVIIIIPIILTIVYDVLKRMAN